MARGTVIRFDIKKGYGSIRPDQSDTPLFVHGSSVTIPNDPPLTPGQVVYFEVLEGRHGRQAIEVRPVQTPNPPQVSDQSMS